jgi:hypothetical protein
MNARKIEDFLDFPNLVGVFRREDKIQFKRYLLLNITYPAAQVKRFCGSVFCGFRDYGLIIVSTTNAPR